MSLAAVTDNEAVGFAPGGQSLPVPIIIVAVVVIIIAIVMFVRRRRSGS